MKKISLLICIIIFGSCNTSNNTPLTVATEKNDQIIPLVPESNDDNIDENKIDLSLLIPYDQLLLTSEVCTQSKYPLISFKRRYNKTSLLYLGNNQFDFTTEGITDPFTQEYSHANIYTLHLSMEKTSLVFSNDNDVPADVIYLDLLLLNSLKFKSIDEKKMVLTANLLNDQCDYSFNIPSVHDTDGDGVDNKLDCAPLDKNRSIFLEYYVDNDGDGIGSSETAQICDGPTTRVPNGYSEETGDCDDNNSNKFTFITMFPDKDGDGFGVSNSESITACYDFSTGLENYTDNNMDCDDDRDNINPNMEEIFGDNIDNNCDGIKAD